MKIRVHIGICEAIMAFMVIIFKRTLITFNISVS